MELKRHTCYNLIRERKGNVPAVSKYVLIELKSIHVTICNKNEQSVGGFKWQKLTLRLFISTKVRRNKPQGIN